MRLPLRHSPITWNDFHRTKTAYALYIAYKTYLALSLSTWRVDEFQAEHLSYGYGFQVRSSRLLIEVLTSLSTSPEVLSTVSVVFLQKIGKAGLEPATFSSLQDDSSNHLSYFPKIQKHSGPLYLQAIFVATFVYSLHGLFIPFATSIFGVCRKLTMRT